MFRLIVFGCFIGVMVCNMLSASGETWTDTTGKFSIDARFQGVEGKSIVLLKTNGQKIKVPIAKLSPESRAQAKSLYQAMIDAADQAADSDTSAAASAKTPIHPARSLDFQPPTPPAMAAMPEFPNGMSMEQTLDFVEQQIFDGHPEVLWYALTDDMRKTFDDPRLRKAVNPIVNEQQSLIAEVESLVFKGIEVLVTKKDFVLGSEKLAELFPQDQPVIRQAYDSVVGVIYELADLGFSLDPEHRSVNEMVDYHLPRIGAHFKSLLAMISATTRAELLAGATVEPIDSDHAVLHFPVSAPSNAAKLHALTVNFVPEEIRMVRVAQRWVPQGIADAWTDLKSKLESGTLDESMTQVQANNLDQAQGAAMMVGMFKGMIEFKLDGLLAAKTQQEFDSVLNQEASMPGAGVGEIDSADGAEMQSEMNAGSTAGDDQPLPEASGPVPEGWTLDMEQMTIPATPAVAYFKGEKVKIAEASIEDNILHLWGSDKPGHFNDNGFIIFLFLDEGISFENQRIDVATTSRSLAPHVHRLQTSAQGGDVKVLMGDYAMKLEFGKVVGGKVTGKIYLCLPDEERSMVRGTFEAIVNE